MLNQLIKPNKVYIAFYKGANKKFGDRLVSSIIKIFTNKDFRDGKKKGINKEKFAHTELIFPDSIAGLKNSYSSRGTDKPSGVNFKEIKYSHPERWVFVELEWFDHIEDIAVAHATAMSFRGAKYAYNNVFNTFGFIRTRKDRRGHKDWWCSEICAYIAGIPNYKVSPNKLYTQVVEFNNEYRKGFKNDSSKKSS